MSKVNQISSININSFKKDYRLDTKKHQTTTNSPVLNANDVFITSQKQIRNKGLMIGGLVLGLCTGAILLRGKVKPKEVKNLYLEGLATGLSEYTGKKIHSTQLSSVISGPQLIEELKGLKRENYIASKENIKNGLFRADIHSHSNYSDGEGVVEQILDQVSQYANKLKAKTGKKFIYSLTDHDNANGVKESLKIISENPKKFENVKFVTGAEMSFAIKSDKSSNKFEPIEALVYGFNPFNKKVSNFFDGISLKREEKAKEFIRDLNDMFGYADFSLNEFNQTYRSGAKKSSWLMNSQWKVYHYGQTKNAVSGLANERGVDKSELYSQITSQADKSKKALWNLKEKGLVPESYGEDTRIVDLCKNKYSPRETEMGIDYASENSFDDIVETFKDEQGSFLALAHPYYITERSSQTENIINNLVKSSKGLLKGTESYHQAYNPSVNLNNVEVLNNHIVRTHGLVELGGRDNHLKDFL